MLILCHLFTGLVLGLLLYRFTGQRWTLWAAALGAMLPDLIDKPLGHILLVSTLDNGRLYAHTLLFLAIVLLIGVAVWKKKGSYVILALAMGIALHQLVDTMFLDPVGWAWPLLGPFHSQSFLDYFGRSIVIELTSGYEWFFGTVSLAIILDQLRRRNGRELPYLTDRTGGLMNVTWLCFVFSLIFAFYGLMVWNISDASMVGALHISALVAAMGGLGLELAAR